ncbi:MAG: hypothetical protein QOI22_644 [Verrucomicrobiota bacterium]
MLSVMSLTQLRGFFAKASPERCRTGRRAYLDHFRHAHLAQITCGAPGASLYQRSHWRVGTEVAKRGGL